MMSFLALHGIAAQRGEGLRPELVRLMERRGCAETDRTSRGRLESADRLTDRAAPDLTTHDTNTSRQRQRSAADAIDDIAEADVAAR